MPRVSSIEYAKSKGFCGRCGQHLVRVRVCWVVVWLSKSLLDFVCVAAFLFPFYADELTTLIVRIKNGDKLTKPHRKHLYQLLANEIGIAHWKVSVGYGVSQMAVGVSVLVMKRFGSFMVLTVLAAYFGAFILLSFYLRKNLDGSV